MTNLDQTLLARACRYGSFVDVANRTNNIFAAILSDAPQLPATTPLYREAMHMIAYKLARLANGRINDADSWHDIAGYAMLVHNQIAQDEEAKAAKSAFATRPNEPDNNPLDTHPAIKDLDDKLSQLMEEAN